MSTQYAFPLADPDGQMQQGMTLRDYFAAKALQSLDQSGYAYPKGVEAMAHDAYALADAMLKARDEVKP
jgi:hypothetical protein